jgi:hypothetical protein
MHQQKVCRGLFFESFYEFFSIVPEFKQFVNLGDNKNQNNQAREYDRSANRCQGPPVIAGYVLNTNQFMPPWYMVYFLFWWLCQRPPTQRVAWFAGKVNTFFGQRSPRL